MKFKIKRLLVVLSILVVAVAAIGCGAKKAEAEAKLPIEDGVYLADFSTDSNMFHVNETWNGKGILTVADGKGTIHIVLTSKNIVNLFEGVVADVDESSDRFLQPTAEEVTYSDGLVEEVNAFDVRVPYLDQEFDLALIGKKAKWYDHKVSVSNPEPYSETADEATANEEQAAASEETVTLTLEGGSGKSTVKSPAAIFTDETGQLFVEVEWSSPHYDYMILDGEKYLPVNTEGNSVFNLPISDKSCTLQVIADTTAMSKPHEIEYTLILK